MPVTLFIPGKQRPLYSADERISFITIKPGCIVFLENAYTLCVLYTAQHTVLYPSL